MEQCGRFCAESNYTRRSERVIANEKAFSSASVDQATEMYPLSVSSGIYQMRP